MGASPQPSPRTEGAQPGRSSHRCATALVAVALGVAAAPSPPALNAPIPRDPETLADVLEQTDEGLRAAIKDWRDHGRPAPPQVVLYAIYQQRIYRLLAGTDGLARQTFARLPAPLATASRDFVRAHRGLYRLTPPIRASAIKVGKGKPALDLLLYYRGAQRRFRVPWNVLAAVNFVESKFGKLRSASAAGAQGPMQFMPATWRQYGLGGNVHDAHDAILGAANYLRASGAPRNLRRALYAYNHSSAYVDAVLRYARRIASDRVTFYALYNWQVFVKTPTGDRRVTGPGLP
jgi:membrane-bound lytic murein transglycosylase B